MKKFYSLWQMQLDERRQKERSIGGEPQPAPARYSKTYRSERRNKIVRPFKKWHSNAVGGGGGMWTDVYYADRHYRRKAKPNGSGL